ncbi:uncharacterized protein LOC110632786 [Hevea brasiliensis]|uniref:uncharacterized protein LOC110632786 n=1 Tax=Hevea brasiliensis TaxID=3981 RepID=UPI0025FC4693|nr:uncharacterized protein LOC110632786 [Hevea brasiliensis]XP_057993202.1 uncharacterized protein LOC110632786 [Hevea brasiliensis]
MLSRLTKTAEEFHVAVYMTNQVIADPGGGVFISDPKKTSRRPCACSCGHNQVDVQERQRWTTHLRETRISDYTRGDCGRKGPADIQNTEGQNIRKFSFPVSTSTCSEENIFAVSDS